MNRIRSALKYLLGISTPPPFDFCSWSSTGWWNDYFSVYAYSTSPMHIEIDYLGGPRDRLYWLKLAFWRLVGAVRLLAGHEYPMTFPLFRLLARKYLASWVEVLKAWELTLQQTRAVEDAEEVHLQRINERSSRG